MHIVQGWCRLDNCWPLPPSCSRLRPPPSGDICDDKKGKQSAPGKIRTCDPQIRSLVRATTSNSQQHVATCHCRPLHYCCCRGQSRRIVGCCPQLSHQWPTETRVPESLRQYVLHWQRWHLGGLDRIVSRKGGVERTWHHVCTHLAGKHPPG